jgi:hypothetical protein
MTIANCGGKANMHMWPTCIYLLMKVVMVIFNFCSGYDMSGLKHYVV